MISAACVPPSAGTAAVSSPSTDPVRPGTCEYIGARFSLPPGFNAKEQREPGDIVARATIEGRIGTHQILLDIIPKAVARYGNDPSSTSLSKTYFDLLKASPSISAKWSDVTEGQYAGPKRTYPLLTSVEPGSGVGVPIKYDNVLLVYAPNDLTRDGYFYTFFWTDIHPAADPRAPLTELHDLADGFTVLASPVGAPSRGCR